MKKLIASIGLLLMWVSTQAQTPEKEQFVYGDTVRTYTMYIPDSLKA